MNMPKIGDLKKCLTNHYEKLVTKKLKQLNNFWKMSRTKDLWEEWRQEELEYLRNKRLSLYGWYGEFTNKELNDSGWDETFK